MNVASDVITFGLISDKFSKLELRGNSNKI